MATKAQERMVREAAMKIGRQLGETMVSDDGGREYVPGTARDTARALVAMYDVETAAEIFAALCVVADEDNRADLVRVAAREPTVPPALRSINGIRRTRPASVHPIS